MSGLQLFGIWCGLVIGALLGELMTQGNFGDVRNAIWHQGVALFVVWLVQKVVSQ